MPSLQRKLRNLSKRSVHRLFRLGQRCGIDILPRHFYSSIPDIRLLETSTFWRKPTSMVGINGTDIDSQLEFVSECCPIELRKRIEHMDIHSSACRENGQRGYGIAEADFLYCVVFTQRPERIVQVGAGVSTAVILRAAEDAGYTVDLTCIDPFPEAYLRRLNQERRIKLLAEPAQQVDLSILTDLGHRGMLFVDSTHTVKVGSEVNRIILEALPRLTSGGLVHFHDIHFPYDYQRSILTEPFFTGETTLLHAFLACNSKFTIRASLSMIHYADAKALQEFLPNYQPAPGNEGINVPGADGQFPSATYLQVIN